ncbi:dynein regulatory complex subunit 2-like [Babylonia areolata]|uniref:dynein regulatory complex subunit 2-like n=1 Tax=Babylonia areolata TaxID=304850 RepID=UPI003FD51A6D
MKVQFLGVKQQLNTIRAEEREKLAKMTLESNAAIKELKRQRAKGQQLLTLAELCRKLETEEEKVVPFYASSLTPAQEENVQAAVLEPPTEPLAAVLHEYTGLENFWKRYSKVLLDKMALEKEKQMLGVQNGYLRRLLKDYLDGVSVNQEVLSQRNTLLVINNKADPRLRRYGDPRILQFKPPPSNVIIEAAHIVKNLLP